MTYLLDATGVGSLAAASAGVSILVATLAFTMAGMAFAAARKRGNRGLRLVAISFAVFGVKNLFSAVNVSTHLVEHDMIELILSLFDLVILGLLFTPFLLRKRG